MRTKNQKGTGKKTLTPKKMLAFVKSDIWQKISQEEKDLLERVRLAEEQSKRTNFDLTGDLKGLI